uniref:Uncharacterized protein n=1 Tax=Plectus sambesii TaxID=2011161 RepID=A0A914VXS1_9BILA
MNWDDEMSPVFSTPPGSPSTDPSTPIWSLPNASSLATVNGHDDESAMDSTTSATQVDMFATQEPSQIESNGEGEVRRRSDEANDSGWLAFVPADRRCRGAVRLNCSPQSVEANISALPASACLFECTFVTECVLRDSKDLVAMGRMVYSDLAFGGRPRESSQHVAQIDAFCQYALILARHLASENRSFDLVNFCREMKHFLLDIGLIRQLATCAQLITVSCQNPNSTLHAALAVWTTAHELFILLDGVSSEAANQIELMDSAYGHVGLVKQSTYLLADSLLA